MPNQYFQDDNDPQITMEPLNPSSNGADGPRRRDDHQRKNHVRTMLNVE